MRPSAGDVSGAVADLGVFVPLAAALVLVNGLAVSAVLAAAGALVIAAGLAFRLPFPVQPLKALTALAVAQGLSADVIHAAGLQIGVLLALLAVTGLADRLSSVFTKPVIRSLQFAVGSMLVVSAIKLVVDPPAVFTAAPEGPWALALLVSTAAVIAVAAYKRWYVVGVIVLSAGFALAWLAASPELGPIDAQLPTLRFPAITAFATAFVVLVIPQIPLTYGNAVVGVSDLAREHFGAKANRVTPGRVALSCGAGNIFAAVVGGMPMCHGSSGLSAHVRLGARTAAMSVMLGVAFLTLGVVFPAQVMALFGLLPVWVLAGFLVYAGLRHALLVLDLRGGRLVVAIVAGVVGIVTGNLALTTAVALLAEHLPRLRRREARLPHSGGLEQRV